MSCEECDKAQDDFFERDGKIRNIGFQINTNQGKLYFKTKSSEREIDYVLQKIKEIKGL
jgi:hypothetical protein